MIPAFRPKASLPSAYVGKTVREPKRPALRRNVKRTPCHAVLKSGAITCPTKRENQGKRGGRGF